jgi:lantibiotic modifying enzyme
MSGFILPALSVAEEGPAVIDFDPEVFAEQLILDLLEGASYENDSFLGWYQRVNNTRDNVPVISRGYNVGVAGIADVLLEQLNYNTSYSQEIKDMLAIVVNQFETDYEIEDIGISWTRFIGFSSTSFFGLRYGSMGINKFLGNAVSELNYDNLIPMINDAISWVWSHRMTNGGWEISPSDYITTGMEYGVTGIGQGFLDLYSSVSNSTYIELSEQAANWLIKVGIWDDDEFKIPWTTMDEGGEFYDDYTSYGVGIAGIMDYFLNLYEITDNSTYFEYAEGLANRLLTLNNEGSFPRNTVGYLTNMHGLAGGYTGFLTGSSGIAHTMLRYYDISEDKDALTLNEDVENYIAGLIYNNGSISFSPDLYDDHFTGYSMGATGVAKYYIDLYNRFGNSEYLDTIHLLLNNIHDMWLEFGFIPYRDQNSFYGFSYNIEDGMAGLLNVIREYQGLDIETATDNSDDGFLSFNTIFILMFIGFATMRPYLKNSRRCSDE